MSQDFKINIDADLNTAEAEQKLNALLKEKHKLTIDVDVSGQNTAKKLKQNIENGLKNVKIDTSAMGKSLADAFNITDKSTISKLQKQLNSMMTSLGKSWDGQKFNIGDGFETSMTSVVNTLKKNAKTLRSSGTFDDFYDYFKNQKILVTDALKKELGDSNYKSLLNQNIGKLVTDTKKSTATINSMWSELNGKFPNLFPDNITNQADQLNHALSVWKQAQADIKKISAENMNIFEAGNVDSRAWDSVINMASKMESALKHSILEATEIGKTTIDLDVNINSEQITSQIREAISSASASAGEALNIDLKFNQEELLSNLRSAINKIATGDEPVKVDIDVDKNGLQEKLNAACHDMEIPVDFKIDSEDIASKIKEAVNSIADIELDLSVNTDSMKKAVDESINIGSDIDNSSINQLQNALQGVNNAGRQSQNIFSSLGGSVKEAFTSIYNVSNLLQDGMYKMFEAGKKATETVKEFNDIKTNLAMATNADSDYIDNLMNDYNSLAQELGSLTSSVAESADSFLRQGRSMADTNSLIKDSLVLSKDAELSSTDASEILTATLNGFQLSADQASRINDILTSIDLESASGADSIGKALMKVASQANNAGVSLEKTSAIIATIKDVTQDSDESIGTALKSVLSRMNQIKAGKFVDAETGESLNDTEKVLKKIGVSMRDNTGMFRDSEGVLDDIAKKWKTLDSNSQKAVATATAGTYQYNKFIAAMDNWDKVEKLTNVAYNSEGTAQKKFQDNYLNSLEAKTNQLKSSLEGLSTSLISDDMYAGFLDGSKAIVDFVDKTNLLKGALAGLGTFGGAFVFKNLTSMIQGTVREFSNLGNAMNLVKSGTIDTKGFKELLNLTQGLSESQMQLVLSSTSLSDAQRVQLLTNSGVAQAEAEATVAAMGLSTANGAATASTVSFSSALEGLFATMMANPIILLTAAVSAEVMVWQSYKQSVEDAVNSASSAGQKFSENTSSLNEQISKVEELRESIASGVLSDEEAYNAKSQLLDIQNQLASTYGESASSIDLVNGKMEEQIALMQQLQVEDAKKTLNENKTGFDKIKSEMTKTRASGIAQFNSGSKDAEAVAEIAKNYVDKGLSLQKDSTGAYTITFKGDVTQAESTLNSFMNDVQNRIDTVGDNNGILEGVIDSTSSELSKFKRIIDEYGDDYNNFLQADLISKGVGEGSPAAILEDYKQAINDYNEALSSGDTSAIDRAKNSFDVMSSTVDGVLEKYSQYKSLFDDVGNSLDTNAIKVNDFKNSVKDMFQGGIDEEYKKIKGWGLDKYEDQIKNGTLPTTFGNVDMDNRKVIKWNTDELERFKTQLQDIQYFDADGNFIESYYDQLRASADNIDTVFGDVINKIEGYDGVTDIAFSHIVNNDDGTYQFLGQKSAQEYIYGILDAAKEDGDLSLSHILDLDKKGIEDAALFNANGEQVGQAYIHGIISGFNENATDISMLTHFAGKEGALGIIKDKNIFKDLTDVDLKSIDITKGNLDEVGSSLKDVVDKAIEIGVVSDDSAESVAKVVDILTDMGLTGSVSIDNLTKSFTEAQDSINKTTSNMESLKSILSESVSGAGMSADSVKAFKDMFGDDADKALEKTANGYHLNQKALAQLQEQQKQSTKTDYLGSLADQQEALRKVEESISKGSLAGQDVSAYATQRDSIKQNIETLQDLAYQYENALSAYNQWQAAMSGGEEGDMYNSIQGNLESAKELYDKGLTGTNKFREFVDLMSNQDLSTASNEEIVSAYESAMPKIKRYFTEGQEGAVNFLKDIQDINSEWAHMNDDGSWKIDFGVGNDQEIADKLGIDVEAVQAVIRKLKDYGFDINLDQPVQSLDELKTSAESAKESLVDMNETSFNGINLDSSSFSEVTDEIEKVQSYIETIQEDSEIDPNVKTEKLQHANEILEYLVQKQQELGQSDIEITVNADELESKINDAKSALGEFKNEGGTVDISLSGAQDAVDNLQTLLYQKETLTNTSAVMSIDTSQVDGEIGEAIALLQEYQTAVNNLNAQNELGKAGVDIDTTEAQQKVQDLASKIQGLDGNTKASLSLDTSEVQSALTTLTETKVNVNAGVNLDTAALGTIQSSISAITPQMLVNAKVDKTLVDGYDPEDKDAKVKFTAEHSDVDAYKPSNKNAKVNYTVHVSGLENLPGNKERSLTYNVKTNGSVSPANGTAHSIGTAHAAGTTNVSANKNWGLKRNEPHALVNELKPEIIVRDGQPFIVNSGDPAFTSLKQGDIVFNGEQSEALLKNGYVTGSHGKLAYEGAHSLGTAFSNGTGKFNVGSSGSKSSSSSKKKSSSSTSSSRNSGSSSSSSSSSNSSSSSADDASEKVIDWIETLLSRVKRITDLAVNSIDRAIGLVNKQVKAADAISKVQAEIGANQEAAQAYLDKANSIDLSDVYKEKIMNGELTVETINDETLQKNIEDYKSYYESYLSAMDNVLNLEDKLTDLAEKRLSIIEDQYDAIGDLKEAIKSGQEENRTLLENLGTSINSDANKNSLKQSITAQSQLYSSLTKKLEAYEAEVESQLKSGLMKKGSEQWYNAQKNIQEFATNITKASSELIELQDKLRQIQYDVLQNSIDSYARQTNKMNAYIDLLGAQDRQVPENLYQQQIKLNNNQIAKQYNLRAKYKKEQEKYDVNSKRYQELAEKINDADVEILNLRKDNESLKDSIYELRFTNIDKAIQKYSDLEDELSNFRDLLNDDAFVDKQGGITDEGLANIALLSQSIGNAKQKIADYTTGLTKLYQTYKNGVISADEYNEKAQEYRQGIQEATKDVKSYQNSLTDLYMKAMQTEVDYLGKIIDKRKKALSQQKEAYEFSKKVNSQSKDINSLKAQYEAIKNSNNLADKAKAKQLAAQIKEKEDELADTKRDHEYDMRSQGYDKMSDELSELLENTEYEISHNADKQLEIINSMLDKEVASYEAAYAKINSIIRETGFNGSSDFRNEQKELSTEQGAQNQKNEATQSQASANKNPSSAASGTKTDKIYEGKSQNDKITHEILKPEETKRKVAELTVDKTSVSLEEGKSIGIKTSVRPNDAANKTLSWTSSNTSIATASNGTIKAIKPGSCTITVATTDGGGISKTIGVTVTKKPEPPKPAKKPTASTSNGKDGILRVGDTATLSGRYYYDSWGQRPAGSKYAGVRDGVTVDSYTSSEYGGNGKSTGDYKVHIGGTDGVYKDLGWVRPDQLSGYKDGIERVPYDQVAEINEGNKDETIITPKGHTLTLLTRNSSVLKNEAQRTLWDIANNPQLFAKNLIAENLVNSMPQGFSGFVNDVKLPDVTTNNRSIVNEYNIDKIMEVQGSIDKETFPGVKAMCEESYKYFSTRTTQEARKLGIKRTR